MLNKSRKAFWKAEVELSSINSVGDGLYDADATRCAITPWPVEVRRAKPIQDARAVQEVMHERVDRDHAGPELSP